MSIREKLNSNSVVGVALALGLIVLASAAIAWQMWPAPGTGVVQRYYFTVDDGGTLFGESSDRVPPFAKDGKEACQAMVYKCGWGKPFVAYLVRYTPEMKQRIEEAIAAGHPLDGQETMRGTEVKRPGDKDWVNVTTDRATPITAVLCPDGTLDGLKAVWP